MWLFTRMPLWSSIVCPRRPLAKRRKRHELRGVVASRILTLVAAAILLWGCRSEIHRTLDVTVDPPCHETVSESPARQPPPSPPIDQGNGEPWPNVPNLALDPDVIALSNMYSPVNLDENHDFFSVEKVQDRPTNAHFVQPNVSLSVPLWQDDGNEWTTSVNVTDTLFPLNGYFTDRQQPSPNDLWNVGSSVTFRHLLENGWIDGVSASVESNSQKPFNSFSQVKEGMRAFLRIPQGQHHFWLFSLSYLSSNEWSLPISKVEHTWQPSDRLQANMGLILPIMDHPQNNLSLDFSVKLLGPVKP